MSVALDFDHAIREEVRRRVAEIVEEETTAACARVTRRIGGEADQLALTLLKRYEMMDHSDHIVIKVQKP